MKISLAFLNWICYNGVMKMEIEKMNRRNFWQILKREIRNFKEHEKHIHAFKMASDEKIEEIKQILARSGIRE